MSRLLFEARAAVLALEAQERVLDKEIELAKLKAAQRQWVGLTDAEILEVLCIWPDPDDDPDDYMEDIREARAIEALLREKNSSIQKEN